MDFTSVYIGSNIRLSGTDPQQCIGKAKEMPKKLKNMSVKELQESIAEIGVVREKLLSALEKVKKAETRVRTVLIEKKSLWVTG